MGDYDDNCRNCDTSVFITDYASGVTSCAECGCCRDDLFTVVECSYKQKELAAGFGFREESYLDGPRFEEAAVERNQLFASRKNSPPYKRETYWSERISQWRLQEPCIEENDWQRIVAKWEEFTGKFRGDNEPLPRFKTACWTRNANGSLACDYVLDKEDCRQLLWAIDGDLKRIGDGKPVFVKKYLVSHFF